MATDTLVIDAPVVLNEVPVIKEDNDDVKVGEYVGQCKWFNDIYGYGFITIQSGAEKGKDIFVHHSGIKPLNSQYKTLKKGEYVNFDIVNGENGLQAVHVTGIGGGSLMCDVLPSIKKNFIPRPQNGGDGSPHQSPPPHNDFTQVQYKRNSSPVDMRSGPGGRGAGGRGGAPGRGGGGYAGRGGRGNGNVFKPLA